MQTHDSRKLTIYSHSPFEEYIIYIYWNTHALTHTLFPHPKVNCIAKLTNLMCMIGLYEDQGQSEISTRQLRKIHYNFAHFPILIV